jgi:glycosyltransferase involved in cell wall biosynthesis
MSRKFSTMAIEPAGALPALSAGPRRIAHLTSVHSTFDVRIFQKECRTLAQAGYDVILIAPHERAECVDGVCIRPVSKHASRWKRMTATAWEVFREAMTSRASVCHFHDPELLLFGVLMKMAGKRVVYDVHENVASDILSKHWIDLRLRRPIAFMAGLIERMAARTFDAVVVATPAIATHFPSRHRVLVQNFPLTGELVDGSRIPYGQRKPNVLYLGAITEMKGAREMVASMEKLPEHLASRLLLLGDIEPETLKHELSTSDGWSHVDALGFQPRSAVARFTEAARVGLVLFRPLPNYSDSQPNKLYEYMSAGLPVIASDFPAWKSMIDEVGCGLVVNPLDPDEIAGAITWILEHPVEAEAMGKRGQLAVGCTYNWKTQADGLLKLYETLFQ